MAEAQPTNGSVRMNHPLISIIIPTFNLEGYIDETLQSVKAQTYPHLDIVVVDDGSTDETRNIVKRHILTDSRINLDVNRRKKGAAGARNTGIQNSKGEWICFLDGDDLYQPDTIEQRVIALNQNPTTRFLGGDSISFKDGGTTHGARRSSINPHWRTVFHMGGNSTTGNVVLDAPIHEFLESVLTNTNCVMIESGLLKETGGFNEDLSSAEDDHLWIRVAARTNMFVFVPGSVSLYRQRQGSLTHSGKALHHDAVSAYLDLLEEPLLKAHHELIWRNIRSFAMQNTFHYRKQKNRLQTLRWAMKALRYDLRSSVSWRNAVAAMLLR